MPVEAELDSLDEKISQLVKLCHRLRTDNQELRQELAAAQSANKQLSEKIAAARTRLETLLTRQDTRITALEKRPPARR